MNQPCSLSLKGNTYQHFLILAHANTLPLHNLDIMQTAQDLMLYLELRAHGELCALLDLKRLILHGVLGAGLGEVDGDGLARGGVHG